MKPFTKKIVLENGREFYGYGFGANGGGDQRDRLQYLDGGVSGDSSPIPSYTGQMVVMTYPLIGNYGTADEDYETRFPTIGGMIVREYNDIAFELPLHEDAARGARGARHPGRFGHRHPHADAHHPRRGFARRCSITDAATPSGEAMRRLREYDLPHDMVSRVSCRKRWYLAHAQPPVGRGGRRLRHQATTSSANSTRRDATSPSSRSTPRSRRFSPSVPTASSSRTVRAIPRTSGP